MRDNQLLQSDATSRLINKIERQEAFEQEERLMKNARYRAMKMLLNRELDHYRELSLIDAEKIFSSVNFKKKTIHHESNVFVLKVKFESQTLPPTLRIMVKPKTLFGSLFMVEDWIHLS